MLSDLAFCEILKTKLNKNLADSSREQMRSSMRGDTEQGREMGEGGQKVQTSSYTISKTWR